MIKIRNTERTSAQKLQKVLIFEDSVHMIREMDFIIINYVNDNLATCAILLE